MTKGEKIKLEVPVQLVGSPVGIKEGGVIQQVIHKVEVECFPKDIPQYLEIEITELKLGDSIHVSDLSYENIEILNTPESVVVAVTHPKVEKVAAEAEEAAPAEPEVISKGKEKEESE